jgi:hypothetical protein
VRRGLIAVICPLMQEESEGMEKGGVPPFDPDKPRYDLSTFWGRVLHFADVINPITLLASAEEIERSQRLIEDFRTKRESVAVSRNHRGVFPYSA